MSSAKHPALGPARPPIEKFDRAVRQHTAGNLKKAKSLYQQVLRKKPDHGDALFNLAVLTQQAGQIARAVQLFSKAVAVDPARASYRQGLAVALRTRGQVDAAIDELRAAVDLAPDDPEIRSAYGNMLKAGERFDEAIASHEAAVALDPDFAEGWSNLGATLRAAGRAADAVEALERAVALQPANPDLLYNLGNAQLAAEAYGAAEAAFDAALRLQPGNARATTNLGIALRQQGRLADAIERFQAAVALDRDYADAHWNLALALLMGGAYEEGWQEYEWRRRLANFAMRRRDGADWDGRALTTGTLLVHAEQGLGDAIQFARYLPIAGARCGRVIFECPERLIPLLSGSRVADAFVAMDGALPDYDAQIPLMSLPGRFWAEPGFAAREAPYLRPDPELATRWAERLAGDGVKIGISWQGNPAYRADATRSIPVAKFAGIARVPGARAFALQKGEGRDQLGALDKGIDIVDLGDELDRATGTFMDTAAVIANLDLVVTSDTAVAHLAGALGAEVWVALAHVPDWRWGLSGDRTPWYPSMRLFRQSRPGDWDGVFAAIERAVGERLG